MHHQRQVAHLVQHRERVERKVGGHQIERHSPAKLPHGLPHALPALPERRIRTRRRHEMPVGGLRHHFRSHHNAPTHNPDPRQITAQRLVDPLQPPRRLRKPPATQLKDLHICFNAP